MAGAEEDMSADAKVAPPEAEESALIEEAEAAGPISLSPEDIFQDHRAKVTSKLANKVFWLLAASGALHYLTTVGFLIAGNKDALETLSSIFDMWLPVISGFFGAAATYYFTRQGD